MIALPPEERTRKLIWAMTFADLLALLLTFFVMLYTMASLQGDKWGEVAEALNQRLNPMRQGVIRLPQTEGGPGKAAAARALDLGYVDALLQEKLSRHPDLADSRFARAGNRLLIRLPAAGTALPVAEQDRRMARALTEALGQVGNRAEVHGYSDASAGEAWSLGLARAQVFADVLTAAGYGRPIAAYGHAEARLALPGEKEAGTRLVMVIREADGNAPVR